MNDRLEEGREIAPMDASSSAITLIDRSEIDMQVVTAHHYPRSIKRFRDEVRQMATLNEQIAQECFYSLPRKEKDQVTGQWVVKPIEGPSARFGEVIASAWGNCRAGSRVVSDQGDFVVARGVFHDLERNYAITFDVPRRITDKNGNRYKADMIGVTANAACSIALRNSILKGVPKAFWSDIYDDVRKVAIGDVQTLGARRSRALAVLQKMGVQQETVFAFLKIAGIEDITLEHLGILFGITTALKEGDTTPEQAFAIDGELSTPAGPQSKSKAAAAEETKASRPAEAKQADDAPDDGSPVVIAKSSQIKFIRAKAEGACIGETEILARFGLTSLDGINVKQVDEILDFIANPIGD